MEAQQAKQTVLVAMTALIGISVYRQKAEPGSLYKRVWGTGVLGLFLSLAADFAPQVAGPFAILTVLGALTRGGDKALVNLFGGGKGAKGTPGTQAGAGEAARVPLGEAPAAPAAAPGTVGPPGSGSTGPSGTQIHPK